MPITKSDNFRLPPDTQALLKKLAADLGVNKTRAVIRAIDESCAARNITAHDTLAAIEAAKPKETTPGDGDITITSAIEAAKPVVRRVALTDGSGRWFDAYRAVRWSEKMHWNGNNYISAATGSQWEHEALYRTAECRFILMHYSQWRGSSDTYEEVSAAEAAAWLSTNGEDAEFAAFEIK